MESGKPQYNQLELFEPVKKKLDVSLLPRFDAPKNDDEKLLNLQYELLASKSVKAKQELWLLSLKLARRFIGTELALKGKRLDRDTYEEKAYDAVIYVMRRYDEADRCYYVKSSFTTQIYGGVKYALYFKTEGQKLYENALHRANETGQSFDEALEFCKLELDRKTELKKGKKFKRTLHREFISKQLELF